MRVILRENIENLGRKGDIVEVAPGYGRNYLLPKKLAMEVTPSNMKMIGMEQQALKKRFEQEKSSHQDIFDKIQQTRVIFFRKTAEKDVIFGSVSSTDIKDALEKFGIDVDKKKIILEEPIKRLGNYTVPIKVYHDERAEVKIEIVKEGERPEAEEAEKKEEIREEKPEEKPEENQAEELKEEKAKSKKAEKTAGEKSVEKEEKEKAETDKVEGGVKQGKKEKT